jgi:NTE family protein
MPPSRVVLACQGGGSHTAFTAGVLRELLRHNDLDVQALSGTSGGAACAYLAWTGLLEGGRRGRELGIARLTEFWERNRPHGLAETLSEDVAISAFRATSKLGLTAELSPYLNPLEPSGDFRKLVDDSVGNQDVEVSPDAPRLLISAADINDGNFRIFRSHPDGNTPADRITSETVLASAAIPTLFRAVLIEQHRYWDGLFSQNPPIRDLPDAARGADAEQRPPEELWAVMINPFRRCGEIRDVDDIRDRRNELAANISFQQEVHFLGKINELAKLHQLAGKAAEKYRPIKVRVITMADAVADGLDYESKLSRNPALLDMLTAHGIAQAERFLAALTRPQADEDTAVPEHDIWGRPIDANWTPLPA